MNPSSPRARRRWAVALAASLAAGALLAPAAASAATPTPAPVTVLFSNFEQGRIAPWSAYGDGVSLSSYHAVRLSHETSLRVAQRTQSSHGVATDITALTSAGQRYTAGVWARLEAGAAPTRVTITAVENGERAVTVAEATTVTADGWTNVSGDYTRAADATRVQLVVSAENATGSFLIDDALLTAYSTAVGVIPDTKPLKDAMPFPLGAATYQRFTTGGPGEVLSRHFDQVTPENYMKPEAWYAADRSFVASNPEADALMDWAKSTGGRVYGHVLAWHSQIPGWFFQNDQGGALTSSDSDKEVLRGRLKAHIDNIAKYFADRYGPYGSAGNPMTAWDVVNEVIADSTSAASNGMRTSNWYNVLGESFVDDAFRFADEAFNHTYAAPGSTRPVSLFINEYGTEGGDNASSKLQRYYDLVTRLLARGVPIDGVGHQFHVSLNTPVGNLDLALKKFEVLPVVQAVTEFDVATGYPATERLLIRQGAYVAQAFDIFRAHDAKKDLYSVTVWGLADLGSWRYYEGAPLLFDDYYQPKWAYAGAIGAPIPAEPKALSVFGGDVALDAHAFTAPTWSALARTPISEGSDFAVRWSADHLTLHVRSNDTSTSADDAVVVQVDGTAYELRRDGTGDLPGVVKNTGTGWEAVVHAPAANLRAGAAVKLNVVVRDGANEQGWNAPGISGDLTLLEDLSTVDVVRTASAPDIDGSVDAAWADARPVTTGKAVNGTDTASAEIRSLWSGDGDTLYLLAQVTDPMIDTSASAAHEKDSVEFFVDLGNTKSGAYTAGDMQLRINANGERSFGAGDAAAQSARVTSAVARVDGGYIVEAAIAMNGHGGPGAHVGLDFQVNDAADGRRIGVRTWADPTGSGWNSTGRWGVGTFVTGEDAAPMAIVLGSPSVVAGGAVSAQLSGFTPGDLLELSVVPAAGASTRALAAEASVPVSTVPVAIDENGGSSVSVPIPADTAAGDYTVRARQVGTLLADAALTVTAPTTPGDGGGTDHGSGTPGTGGQPSGGQASGSLSSTGGDASGLIGATLGGVLLLAAGALLLRRRRLVR